MKETLERFGDLKTGEKLICTMQYMDGLEIVAKAETV